MDLPVVNQNLVNLISLVVSLITFVLVLVLSLKIRKNSADEEKFLVWDKHLREDLSKKIEELAISTISGITGDSAKRLEDEVQKFIRELTDLSDEKSREIAAYVQKAEQEQVKESQFFVANMLSKAEKEVEEYKKNKISKVDEQIREIVISAAREVIGRAISLSEHEDLVNKALEKAKKDQIFT
jgi:flagellar biosynthesis/type III secretory pathway protein FliH